jgi:hypothetical protein
MLQAAVLGAWIILEWVTKKYGRRMLTGFVWLRIGTDVELL